MGKVIDIRGQKYGRLTVLELTDRRANTGNRRFWKCLCKCGSEVVVTTDSLKSGNTKSCGCYKRDIHATKRGEQHPGWKGGLKAKKEHTLSSHKMELGKCCETCGATNNLCWDHDHKTGKFRGTLCSRCNLAIGLMGDNPERLLAAHQYLQKAKCVV